MRLRLEANKEELDRRFMAAAIRLGRRMRGRTWPNPAVGALIVRDFGQGPIVIGMGATGVGGRPHAEALALKQAGELARDATLYVSLEPCAWRSDASRNRPCSDLLIAAGLARVVVAMSDPHPEVSGRGIALLRTAGIAVQTNILANEAYHANAGHHSRVLQKQPFVTLKLAISADDKIGHYGQGMVPITGTETKAFVHGMRVDHDAILIGRGTAMLDDPQLTCRLPGLEKYSPIRIILDSKARLNKNSALARSARDTPVWLVCDAHADENRLADLITMGVHIFPFAHTTPMPFSDILYGLAEKGITRLMIEGGAQVANTVLSGAYANQIIIFQSSKIIGTDGIPVFASAGLERLYNDSRYHLISETMVGMDQKRVFMRGNDERAIKP